MTDSDSPEEPIAGETPLSQVVALHDFADASVNAVLADVDIVDCDALSDIFRKTIDRDGLSDAAKRALELLNAICTFHLRVDDKGSPYGPMWIADGRRSAIPEDYRGAQAEILIELAPTVEHPGLRARLADTVWVNDLKNKTAADLAIDGYADVIDGVLSGRYKHRFESGAGISLRSVDVLKRAFQIASRTRKSSALPERLLSLLLSLLAAAETAQALVAFNRLGELALTLEALPASELAQRAEHLAASALEANVMVRRPAYQLAASAYRETKDEESALRCRLAAAELLVAMADGMDSAAAAAHWLMDAIQEYRTIKGTKERRKELEVKLREVQSAAFDEMGSFSIPMDLKPIIESMQATLEGQSLSSALYVVACLAPSRPTDQLRAAARRSLETAPLSAMFGAVHLDRDGKVTGKSPGASLSDDPDEAWYEHQVCQEEKLHRHLVVAGHFETARRMIAASYPISERHFMPIAEASPFVPAGYQYIFALGFARLFQGDPVSAAHLLLPQLENSMRDVLLQHGGDPTLIQSDMIQEDRSLSAMLDRDRSALEKIFGEALIGEIDRLFNSRLGPAIRHDWAHGKLSLGDCLGPDVIYACWLIYSITCIPLLGEHWRNYVAPAIEAEAA